MTALRMMDGQCTVSAVGGPGEHENTQILKYKYVDTPHSRGSDRSIARGRSGSAIGCALFSAQVWHNQDRGAANREGSHRKREARVSE